MCGPEGAMTARAGMQWLQAQGKTAEAQPLGKATWPPNRLG